MVAASSPFGLSKAALERRVNSQLPRKRHTPCLVTKKTTRVTPKHVARPKSKSNIRSASRSVFLSHAQQIRPEKRGTNRTRIVGTSSDGISHWSARRILASRPHPVHPLKFMYKVQWETTWEHESEVNGLITAEWKEAVHEGSTFKFQARDGSEWTVLKDAASLENDSEDSQWEMWRAIRRNAVREVDEDWVARVKDEDFEFANEEDELKVKYVLGEKWSDEEMSATNVLRAFWDQVNNDFGLLETDLPLGNAKVRFVAQIDPWMIAEEDREVFNQENRPAFSIKDIFRAVAPNPLHDLEDDAFSKSNAHSNYSHWRGALISLIRIMPFIFKGGTWLQLLALLILGSEALQAELASTGIEVQEDWCQRAREFDMHMYYEQIVDNRSPHDIQETFLNLRDFFRDLRQQSQVTFTC